MAERALGSDGDLVASMISTSVIPRVCKLIEGGALDVYSEGHIRRIINLAEEVEASIEGENARYQAGFLRFNFVSRSVRFALFIRTCH